MSPDRERSAAGCIMITRKRSIAVVDVLSFEVFAEQIASAKRNRNETIAFLEGALEYLRGEL